MSALTNALAEGLIRANSRIGFVPTVTQPTPDFSGPGVAALQTIAGVVLAIVLVLAVIGGLISAGLIAVGHTSDNTRLHKAGIIGLVCCIAGAAIAGSIGGLINWGQSLKVA